MFSKQLDILVIGDTATDAFIRLKDAALHCKVKNEDCEICLPFGAKVPFEYVKVIKAAGNAGNAAVCAARLGLKTALVSDLGTDQNGADCLAEFKKNGVITSYVKQHPGKPTNYHFVLWYEDDRTILVNHTRYDYKFPLLHAKSEVRPKWIYLTSLAAETFAYEQSIISYLESHPEVRLAFQPGTFQIGEGMAKLQRLYSLSYVCAVNVEEAQKLLRTDSRDIKYLMRSIRDRGPRIVLITDGLNGSYMYDGEFAYHMPSYPDPRRAFERTGCGDAYTATFVSALAMGKSPLEALVWAPVNPMSVAQFLGSQEGLMSLRQLEWWLERAPAEYKPREI